jgi:hypothetical protein
MVSMFEQVIRVVLQFQSNLPPKAHAFPTLET